MFLTSEGTQQRHVQDLKMAGKRGLNVKYSVFKVNISVVQSTWSNLRGLTGGRAVGRIGGLMGGLTGTAEKSITRHIWCIC